MFTIVLILSIFCLGGCDMEEQKDVGEVEEVVEYIFANDTDYQFIEIYIDNHIKVLEPLDFETIEIIGDNKFLLKQNRIYKHKPITICSTHSYIENLSQYITAAPKDKSEQTLIVMKGGVESHFIFDEDGVVCGINEIPVIYIWGPIK